MHQSNVCELLDGKLALSASILHILQYRVLHNIIKLDTKEPLKVGGGEYYKFQVDNNIKQYSFVHVGLENITMGCHNYTKHDI